MYDNNNIFAKIIRKEIPCEPIYEDEHVLFFNDISPQAKIHVLGIPKISVINLRDFVLNAEKDLINHFFDKVVHVINILDLNESGYRLITNDGPDSGQEVPHFHIHILGGESINRLI